MFERVVTLFFVGNQGFGAGCGRNVHRRAAQPDGIFGRRFSRCADSSSFSFFGVFFRFSSATGCCLFLAAFRAGDEEQQQQRWVHLLGRCPPAVVRLAVERWRHGLYSTTGLSSWVRPDESLPGRHLQHFFDHLLRSGEPFFFSFFFGVSLPSLLLGSFVLNQSFLTFCQILLGFPEFEKMVSMKKSI